MKMHKTVSAGMKYSECRVYQESVTMVTNLAICDHCARRLANGALV